MLDIPEVESARFNETRYDDEDEEINMPCPEHYNSPYMSSHSSTDDLEIYELKHQAALERSQWRLRVRRLNAAYVWKKTRCFLILFSIMLVVVLATLSWFRRRSSSRKSKLTPLSTSIQKWAKPSGFRIAAVIFYGRPATVSILDCYLKRNLVDNGGYLDEVLWMTRTDRDYDLTYLGALVNATERYTYVSFDEKKPTFQKLWSYTIDPNTLYIKIDDDMIYMHDDAIPRLVETRLKHPEAFDVAANIINSPLTNWLHYHAGAVKPFLPEARPMPQNLSEGRRLNWRNSELPIWSGMPEEEYKDGNKDNGKTEPPYKGHRWLPLPDTPRELKKTPIVGAQYDSWGNGWTRWTIGAQQHYSFFANLENGELGKYRFGGEDGIWNMQYDRYNLNFVAIWGKDVAAHLPKKDEDDEQAYTVSYPKELSRPLLIDTHAIVSHLSFGIQNQIYDTDLLDRYRAYANEFVCTADNQIRIDPLLIDITPPRNPPNRRLATK